MRDRLALASESPGLRRFGRFAAWGLVGFLGALLLAIVFSVVAGQKLVTIDSGSQAPSLRKGDVAFERQEAADGVKVDQIITFSAPLTGNQVTHRVRAIEDRGDKVRILTKGDSSPTFERFTLPDDGEVGVVVRRIPLAGHVADLLGGPLAIALLSFVVVGLAGALRLSSRRLRPET